MKSYLLIIKFLETPNDGSPISQVKTCFAMRSVALYHTQAAFENFIIDKESYLIERIEIKRYGRVWSTGVRLYTANLTKSQEDIFFFS